MHIKHAKLGISPTSAIPLVYPDSLSKLAEMKTKQLGDYSTMSPRLAWFGSFHTLMSSKVSRPDSIVLAFAVGFDFSAHRRSGTAKLDGQLLPVTDPWQDQGESLPPHSNLDTLEVVFEGEVLVLVLAHAASCQCRQ